MRHQLLDEIARAAAVGHATHGAARVKRTILMLLLRRSQGIRTQHIVETVEHDVVVESRVAVLVGMFRIPVSLRVNLVLTVLHQIDRLSVRHTVLVDHVRRRVMDNLIMSHQTFHLRTEDLRAVPVGRVRARIHAAEDGLRRARHIPVLLHRIDYVRIVRLSILVTHVFVNVRILILCQLIRHLALSHHIQSLAKSLGGLLTIGHVVIIRLAVRAGTQQLGYTARLHLLHLLHQRTACPEIALAKIAQRHELIHPQVVLA